MRHAVYYLPGDDTALGRFGARLFGRWPDGRPAGDTLHHPELQTRVGRAARYGFHATLKAPFRLVHGQSIARLRTLVERIADDAAPIDLGSLQVERYVQGSDTWALCCASASAKCAGRDVALSELAARCVRGLDSLRAPLDPAERARRRPAELSPEARDRLERWGYPWVLEGFRFHMTLARAGAAAPGQSGAGADHEPFETWLKANVAAALNTASTLDRLALSVEHEPGAPFRRIAEFPLTGSR